ncbi:MAG: hypothetical protein ACE14L_14235 [Terriglobales bacterium]
MRKTALLLLLCVALLSAAQQTPTTKRRKAASTTQQEQTPPAQATEPAAAAPAEPAAEPAPAPPLEGMTFGIVGQQPPTTTSRTHPMYPEVSPDMLRAPQPGHPLDMRDVDILTGKNKQQYVPPAYYNYGAPGYVPFGGVYEYYPYGVGPMPSFTTSGLLPNVNTRPRSRFTFGVFDHRPFFFVGNTALATNPFANPFAFGGAFTPFTPVAPVFTFGNFSRAPEFDRQKPFAGSSRTQAAPTRRTPSHRATTAPKR